MEQNLEQKENMVVKNLEYQIKNNQFNSKEELTQHMIQLRNSQASSSVLDNQKMQELLNLFDSLRKKEELPLDMNEYREVKLENQNLIVSQKEDRVLKTLEGTSEFTNEFLQAQNEIVANTPDGLTNADTAFKHMADNQKEEMTLLSLTDSMSLQNIDVEILNKIRFFITNIKMNHNSFRVDVNNGIFYNIETSEVYEVRKDANTNEYQIFRGQERIYGSNTEQLTEENNAPQLENEHAQETMSYEASLFKPKTRVRKLERNPYTMNNAAFTKVGFLIINILTFAILTGMVILLNK